jgi:hypothetical protein
MKVSELSGAALDWAVALCEGWKPEKVSDNRGDYWWFFKEPRGMNPKHYHPSTHWGIGGAIIARERISLLDQGGDCWLAICGWKEVFGDTQLEAAMRAYVTSKLGDEIQIPEEEKA